MAFGMKKYSKIFIPAYRPVKKMFCLDFEMIFDQKAY